MLSSKTENGNSKRRVLCLHRAFSTKPYFHFRFLFLILSFTRTILLLISPSLFLFVCCHCSFSFYFDLIRFFFRVHSLFHFVFFFPPLLPLLFLSFFYCPMSHPFFCCCCSHVLFSLFLFFYSLRISRHDISRKKVRFECLTFIFILLFFPSPRP